MQFAILRLTINTKYDESALTNY